MSGLELKSCPFCGAELIIGKQRIASCKTEGCAVQHRGVDLDYPKHITAWNTRTPDPAQIRADAIREAVGVLNAQYKRALELSDKDLCHDGKSYAAAAYGWSEQAILALLATPLSPPAVDTSPAPDAGDKEDK